ncbi:MAG: metal ABC transporter solute-binding protein, Zn/Mn family [Syntrophales bacterium]
MKKTFLLILAITVLALLLLLSCQKNEKVTTEGKKLKVVATLFPLYDFAKQVGRERIEVSLLLPPGVEAHAFEPRPADIKRIQDADIFLFTNKFMEPWVGGLLKGIDTRSLTVVDTSQGITLLQRADKHGDEEHGGTEDSSSADPHIWLDLSNAMRMVDTIASQFIAKDHRGKDFYAKNAEEYKKKLEELDKKYKNTFAHCANRVIVHAGHFAFGYLTKRYGLTYVSAYKGFSPDAEPTPKRLVEITKNVRKYGVKYIYYEELSAPRVADVIAKETGCGLLMLHGAHNVSREEMNSGITFISLMERNLENLKAGLQCR